ncbi:MAG: hypothetical protein V8T36_02645 [Ruthenibacterium lactatiformans]
MYTFTIVGVYPMSLATRLVLDPEDATPPPAYIPVTTAKKLTGAATATRTSRSWRPQSGDTSAFLTRPRIS